MGSPTTYLVAVLPWLIEAVWVWRWMPAHARRLRKQRELETVFGPGHFDMTAPPPQSHDVVFVLYHLPLMLVGFGIPTGLRIRHPQWVLGLIMLGTPILYSGVALWLG